jgi:NTP pyrophosphatase (non-canonical NTP hydrolase)
MIFEDMCLMALVKLGEQSQKEMMVEECAELIHALKKYDRNRVTADAVIEELVDVSLALVTMKIVFDSNGKFEAIKARKIARFEERLR